MHILFVLFFSLKSNKERVANLPKDIELGIAGARIQTEAGFKAHVVFPTPDCTSSLCMYQCEHFQSLGLQIIEPQRL